MLAILCLASCGPSTDDLIDGLGQRGEDLEMAKQELLLAKGEAIPDLLAAFEEDTRTEMRVELTEVLTGLLMRLEDERLSAALRSRLVSDPDAAVRARIAHELGILKRADFADEILQATGDEEGDVRARVFRALHLIRDKLTEPQEERLVASAREHLDDGHRDSSLEARIIVAEKVIAWLKEARGAALKGSLAAADSIYKTALSFAPEDKKANFAYGRFLYDNEHVDEAIDIWRRSGWLLDIPAVEEAPVIDGRLEDSVWDGAARTGPFYSWGTHSAAQLSEHVSDVAIVRTGEALYFGAYCEEAHPESLVVTTTERDQQDEPHQDLIEFFFDIDLDRKNTSKITVNSLGVITDACSTMPNWRDYDYSWTAESEAAAFVGDDHWSVEYKLLFGQKGLSCEPEIPHPKPGSLWGIDIQRGYRAGVNWSQWTRSYPDMRTQETYGFFLF